MSLNEFWNYIKNMNFLPILLIILAVITLGGIIGFKKAKKGLKKTYGEQDDCLPLKSQKAVVLTKSSAPSEYNKYVNVNKVVFEYQGGTRAEFAIKDQSTFNMIVEGDEGTLSYRGNQFVSFVRG